jgi:predicted Zn-dependent peptidase
LICDYELNKIKNKIEASFIFSEINSFNRAMNLAYYELLGDANYINLEVQKTMEITAENVQRIAKQIFVSTNCSTIYYYSK